LFLFAFFSLLVKFMVWNQAWQLRWASRSFLGLSAEDMPYSLPPGVEESEGEQDFDNPEESEGSLLKLQDSESQLSILE
jgi:hypothetical protein